MLTASSKVAKPVERRNPVVALARAEVVEVAGQEGLGSQELVML